jgi:hypothetical protein
MKVTLSRNSPMGRKGQTRDIDASSVRAAFVLGLAEPYIAPPEPVKPKRKAVEDAPKPKRTYKRKDMEAEEPVAVILPEPEPEPETEPEESPDTDGDDETAVRL